MSKGPLLDMAIESLDAKNGDLESAASLLTQRLHGHAKHDKAIYWAIVSYAAHSLVRETVAHLRDASRGNQKKSGMVNRDAPNVRKLSRIWTQNYYVNGKRLGDALIADLQVEIGRSKKVVGTLTAKIAWLEGVVAACADKVLPIGKQLSEERIDALAKEVGYAITPAEKADRRGELSEKVPVSRGSDDAGHGRGIAGQASAKGPAHDLDDVLPRLANQ